MDDCTKVLVYGSFDGFAYSTDDSLLISVVLDGGEKVEIPEEFIVSADQMVNKYKIKLKDVIARIENFDLATKAVWINEILNKLGSDYGLHKYYAGYKQGKFDGAMEERGKVTVPQFVADYIEFKKKHDFHVYGAMREIEDHYDKRVPEWFYENNIETFVRAWLDGYTVEKEKKYTVKLTKTQQYLYCIDNDFTFVTYARNDLKEIREQQEVEIPQFIADFITEQKKLGHTLSYSIDACMSDRVAEWYWDNSELFARAWIDGYKVENKRYLVKIKGVGSISFLNHNVQSDLWSIDDEDNGGTIRTHHTLKELEKAGFGWVFECPGVEIEEVK